jgi:hypothetical protein
MTREIKILFKELLTEEEYELLLKIVANRGLLKE